MQIVRYIAGAAGLLMLAIAGKGFFALVSNWSGGVFLFAAVEAVAGALALWTALKVDFAAPMSRAKRTLLTGVILGALGFLGGYLVPLATSPGEEPGVMLGIFVTGPLGFLLGCVVGMSWGNLVAAE